MPLSSLHKHRTTGVNATEPSASAERAQLSNCVATGDMALARSVGSSARTCMYIALQALYRVGALFLSNDKLPVIRVHYSFCQRHERGFTVDGSEAV